MFRLRNDIIAMLRELPKIITELHEPGRLVTAAAQIKFLCCWEAVRSEDPPKDRCRYALSDHHRRVCCEWISACAQEAVPTPISS